MTLTDTAPVAEPRTSLRERKKLATRRSLRRHALDLVAQRGFMHVTVEDIAEALRLTPQAIYYRLRNERMNLQVTPGEPNAPEAALTPESAVVASDPTPADDSALLPDPKLPD